MEVNTLKSTANSSYDTSVAESDLLDGYKTSVDTLITDYTNSLNAGTGENGGVDGGEGGTGENGGTGGGDGGTGGGDGGDGGTGGGDGGDEELVETLGSLVNTQALMTM